MFRPPRPPIYNVRQPILENIITPDPPYTMNPLESHAVLWICCSAWSITPQSHPLCPVNPFIQPVQPLGPRYYLTSCNPSWNFVVRPRKKRGPTPVHHVPVVETCSTLDMLFSTVDNPTKTSTRIYVSQYSSHHCIKTILFNVP